MPVNGAQKMAARHQVHGLWARLGLYRVLQTPLFKRKSQSFSPVRSTLSCLAHALCLTKSVLVMATVPGLLSCLTAAFWGSVRSPITSLATAYHRQGPLVLGSIRPRAIS